MKFTKMHALGNDFILIDARSEGIEGPSELSRRLCKRRFGVGADQMLLLEVSEDADFGMRIFNADGSEVEMCGNGIRCLARYIWDRGLSNRDVLDIETPAGIIRPEKNGTMVRVDMGEPRLEGKDIPVDAKGKVIDLPLRIGDRTFKITCVSMGNPHAVIFIDKIEGLEGFPVGLYGAAVETHQMFPKKTNVEFIDVLGESELRMRVWERGAGETPACGTGASAAVVASCLKGLTGRKVTVHLDGGDLHIEWAVDNRVYMTGPAEEVFLGEIKT
jgi:diaminopimelate epimerase